MFTLAHHAEILLTWIIENLLRCSLDVSSKDEPVELKATLYKVSKKTVANSPVKRISISYISGVQKKS